MSDPAEFVDAEIIKSRLDEIKEQLNRIEGKLEALMAAIEGTTMIQDRTLQGVSSLPNGGGDERRLTIRGVSRPPPPIH